MITTENVNVFQMNGKKLRSHGILNRPIDRRIPRKGTLSMMEQPDPCKHHGHPVLIAGLNHLVVAHGTGSAMYFTPLFFARSILSPNGKNASLPRATSVI